MSICVPKHQSACRICHRLHRSRGGVCVMSLSEQIGKGFQSTQSRFRNSPKRRRCNAIECNFSVKKTYAFAFCMFCTSDIVNGAELFAERQYFSSLASIGFGIFFTLLCFVPFYSIKHRTRLDFQPLQKHIANGLFLCFFILLYVFHRDNRFFSDKILRYVCFGS